MGKLIRIIDGRDTGKTRRILEVCSLEPESIIVSDHPYRIKGKCAAYGIREIPAIHFHEFMNELNSGRLGDHTYYIDDIESFLFSLSSKINGYTATNED